MAETSAAIPQLMTFSVPPAANAQALDTAIRTKINTLANARIEAGGAVFFNTVAVSGYTVIVTSADVITYTAQIHWMESVDPA